jgi:hypothetical protein
MKDHPVYAKIDELVRSQLAVSGAPGVVARAIAELRPSAHVDPGDRVEAVAADVCALACREAGVVLRQPAVAARLRDLLEASERKFEVVTAALASVGKPRAALPPALRYHDALRILADEILTAPDGRRFVRERPIEASAVCRECDPSGIRFTRTFADTGAWKDQVDTIHEWVMKRLEQRGLNAQVETGVWTRRGECRTPGHDERGHGWFELPVILVRADLGGGVVIEREYEIQ